MYQNRKLTRVIEGILALAHQPLETLRDGQSVRVANGPYMPLIISRISPVVVHIEHPYEQNGDHMQDPGMYLFTGYRIEARSTGTPEKDLPSWVPMELIQNPMGKRYEVLRLDSTGQTVARVNLVTQRMVGQFGETWATNLRAQGWLDKRFVTFPQSPPALVSEPETRPEPEVDPTPEVEPTLAEQDMADDLLYRQPFDFRGPAADQPIRGAVSVFQPSDRPGFVALSLFGRGLLVDPGPAPEHRMALGNFSAQDARTLAGQLLEAARWLEQIAAETVAA